MPELVVVLEKQIIKRMTLKSTSVTLGRHAKNDITLQDRTISQQHARITQVRDDCFLEDLNSTNGTYVNHQNIEQHYLEDGDIISLGKYQIIFRSTRGIEAQLQRLTIHPKLLDPHYPAWLKIVDGRKTGYVIPLTKERITLGNQQSGRYLIELTPHQGYVLQPLTQGNTASAPAQPLKPGEEFKIGDVTLQFCLKLPNANTHT
ncbi:FHA domain-containing protein [Candidatus Thiothrix anitrata]|jgi:hypothetical protein|uniref:FHA domain-containing protein n=1 Tax=Candidatus Thiothrix anitrata TaxID=2823902 RepID=A0ABX7X7Z3_9GAMM|nr:FHA domain-containing protein [Candidatus Thiothrix anitrata]QTR49980.1 FHA domain-containing protein [Candidatus Thiothrix anitrata]